MNRTVDVKGAGYALSLTKGPLEDRLFMVAENKGADEDKTFLKAVKVEQLIRTLCAKEFPRSNRA